MLIVTRIVGRSEPKEKFQREIIGDRNARGCFSRLINRIYGGTKKYNSISIAAGRNEM